MSTKGMGFFYALVVLIVVYGLVINLSHDQASERLLSKFANPKESYAMLLEGYVEFKGDTVFFDLLPAVSFEISDDEKDRIIVKKSTGESMEFTREIASMYGIPNPTGDGKSMKSWQTRADYSPDSQGEMQKREKEFFQVFKKVVRSGKIYYGYFDTKEKLAENFRTTYEKDPEKAEKLAEKVLDPLFSSRGME